MARTPSIHQKIPSYPIVRLGWKLCQLPSVASTRNGILKRGAWPGMPRGTAQSRFAGGSVYSLFGEHLLSGVSLTLFLTHHWEAEENSGSFPSSLSLNMDVDFFQSQLSKFVSQNSRDPHILNLW